MADFQTTMSNYSPDNRLTFEQYVRMAAAIQERRGVSSFRAMRIVEETLAQRQAILDERVKAAGGKPWSEIKADPEAATLWEATPPSPPRSHNGSTPLGRERVR